MLYAIRRRMWRLLYLFTGLTTAVLAIWALGWAVWGAGIFLTEYLSLFGSLLLLAAALMPSRRIAARAALLGAAGVWSLYLPAMANEVRSRLTDQELKLAVLLWSPSASPLVIEQSKLIGSTPDIPLSSADIQQIKDTRISGTVSLYQGGNVGSGKQSRVILIMQGQVDSAVELREPDATSIVYLQQGTEWRMFPPKAPTLERQIRIQPEWDDHNQTSILVRRSDGRAVWFGVFWPKPKLEGRNR